MRRFRVYDHVAKELGDEHREPAMIAIPGPYKSITTSQM